MDQIPAKISSAMGSNTSTSGYDTARFFIGGSEYETEDIDNDDLDPPGKVIIGICAMAKKSQSKPMQEILVRLDRFEHLSLLQFDEDTILNKPIDQWPICDCLISFHSKGFPLEKAVKYSELRQPMLINDLKMQYIIQDRRAVHQILQDQGIDQPNYAVLDRESGNPDECAIVEMDDTLEVDHVTFHKPFVEKPISAEDHNVYIYFPTSAGGGSQRLFRKIGSRSSVYSSVSTVRKTGSFIYEEFMPTDGTDVKVYTVGPDYAHAEARKSPALDGKVERDKDGKEVRYPVILTAKEKLMARKVCLAFKQAVCGFDLLRANGKSYVCDVNGFSFVKTSPKYYDDCAKILGYMILRQLAPQLHIPYSITYQPEDIPIVPTTYGTMMELRCVVAVIRHGDRTPKQKMKMEVRHRKFFHLFEKYGGYKTGHLKLKRPKQLQEVLDIARFLLSEIKSNTDPEIEEKTTKLEQLKSVLEMWEFSGINRKVQLKYQPRGYSRSSEDEYDVFRRQLDAPPREPSLVLILKWGGELTPAGKIQAEELGKAFRCMYPGGAGDFGQAPGMGLLRLHSTFRHDLKIYASDEGRVQMTAAAFAKGFLALEGELPPILAQMVKSANMNGLLDNDNESPKYQNIVKEKLQEFLNVDETFTDEDIEKLAPTGSQSLINAIKFVGNPFQTCTKIHDIMQRIVVRVKELKEDPKAEEYKLYHGESWELMLRRWLKLNKDFSIKNGKYDISKIPDIYDCIKYDLLHNQKILRFAESDELHSLSKAMADIVIPQEYGITKEEKLLIGQCICNPLLKKIQMDLQHNFEEDTTRLDSRYSEGVSTPNRHVRTRLYFTSESHIHSLLTILRYGGFLDVNKDEQWRRAMEYVDKMSELNYMTQIVIMMYEDPTKDPHSEERFHVEIHFSPGAYTCGENKKKDPNSRGYRSQISEKKKKKKSHSGEDGTKENSDGTKDLSSSSSEDSSQGGDKPKQEPEHGPTRERVSSAPTELIELRKQIVKANAAKRLLQSLNDESGTKTSEEATTSKTSEIPSHAKENETSQDIGMSEMFCGKKKANNGTSQPKKVTISDTVESTSIEPSKQCYREGEELQFRLEQSCIDALGLTAGEFPVERSISDITTISSETLMTFDKNELKFSLLKEESAVVESKSADLEEVILESKDASEERFVQPSTSFSPEPSSEIGVVKSSADSSTTSFQSAVDPMDFFGMADIMEVSSESERLGKALEDFEDKSVSSATDQPKAEPMPIYNGGRKRHHSGNAVKALEEQLRRAQIEQEQQEGKASSLEDKSCDMTQTKLSDTRSVSMEDNMQSLHMDNESGKVDRATSRNKRHSFLGIFAHAFPLDRFTWENLRIGGKSSLISTKVINGSSSSAPDLTEVESTTYVTGDMEGWRVPSVRPLETLHNALIHKQVEAFLARITDTSCRTPMSSPSRGPSTPICITPKSAQPPPTLLGLPGYVGSACSSGGPSSPTSASNPDDIMRKLKMLIARSESTESTHNSSEPPSQVEYPPTQDNSSVKTSQSPVKKTVN